MNQIYVDEPMNDADLIEKLEKVTDPAQALALIVEHDAYLGYDPYFKEIRDALMSMAQRLSERER